ncbi:MAG TPA: DUF1858 domain-containing protein [candidate division Zixibacteria bacterium]|nr:DUF1858 domain-containing protein [candidate division Zixibacteria bacterium]
MNREQTVYITPETKVGRLLEAYPDLEEVLIELAPAFKKLRNPILRKTVARMTSLRQAAAVGELSVSSLVNRLRQETGQEALESDSVSESTNDTGSQLPDWVKQATIHETLDARELIERGEHPLAQVTQAVKEMPEGSIFKLITPFVPAPMIDILTSQGFESCHVRESEAMVVTFIRHG